MVWRASCCDWSAPPLSSMGARCRPSACFGILRKDFLPSLVPAPYLARVAAGPPHWHAQTWSLRNSTSCRAQAWLWTEASCAGAAGFLPCLMAAWWLWLWFLIARLRTHDGGCRSARLSGEQALARLPSQATPFAAAGRRSDATCHASWPRPPRRVGAAGGCGSIRKRSVSRRPCDPAPAQIRFVAWICFGDPCRQAAVSAGLGVGGG